MTLAVQVGELVPGAWGFTGTGGPSPSGLNRYLGLELMHRDISPESTKRHLCELGAESCAFLVCHSLGLDTSRYSFAYIANWADDPADAELLPAAAKACKTADAILETLRGLFLRSQEGSFATF